MLVASSGAVAANTSHAGWPRITGMLLMNKQDQSRPLDGRPVMHAHFGRGEITCSPGPRTTLFLSRRSERRYGLHGCRNISYFTRGY